MSDQTTPVYAADPPDGFGSANHGGIQRMEKTTEIDALREAHKVRFFTFLRKCGVLLGRDNEGTAQLVNDPSWFFAFDDKLTPEQAVAEFRRHGGS